MHTNHKVSAYFNEQISCFRIQSNIESQKTWRHEDMKTWRHLQINLVDSTEIIAPLTEILQRKFDTIINLTPSMFYVNLWSFMFSRLPILYSATMRKKTWIKPLLLKFLINQRKTLVLFDDAYSQEWSMSLARRDSLGVSLPNTSRLRHS